jgi:hypothetical protein
MSEKPATDTLEIIERQITSLKAKETLDMIDVRRLDMLMRLRQVILEKPTEITVTREFQDYTEKEILNTLKPRKPNGKKKKAIKR